MADLKGACLVALLAVIPWLPLRHGQYLFDDAQLVETNPSLAAVSGAAQAFSFSLKPSKPVSNVILALGHWLGGGRVEAQRILSLSLHALTAGLFFWVLASKVPLGVAGLCAVWFAWLPLHAEALSVAWFRMDVLGTGFAFLAAAFALSSWWWPAFFAVGAASLSKEVFVVLAPLAVVAATGRKRAFWLGVPWAAVVAILLLRDAGSSHSYKGVLGFVMGWRQVFLAPMASAEWLVKTLSGQGLTTTSLLERWVSAPSATWALGLGLLGAAFWTALFFLFRRRSPAAPWAGAALGGLLLYAAIPNLNLGAERYGYFPAACFAAIVACSIGARRRLPLFLGLHALVLLLPLWVRLSELETRVSHYAAEARHHPEVGTSWSNAAVALLELPDDAFLDDAKEFLERAHRLAPENSRVWLAEFAYRFRRGDADAYAELWREQRHRFDFDARISAGLEFQLGLLQAGQGRCEAASELFHSAVRRDAHLGQYPRPFCG